MPLSVVEATVNSIYSLAWYRVAARERPTTRPLLHPVILLAITWSVVLVKIHYDLAAFADGDGRRIVAQVPPLTLVNGTLSTPEARRYTVTAPDTGETLAVIDTTTSDPPPDTGDAHLVLTRSQLVVHRSAVETRVFEVKALAEMAGVKDGTLTSQEL